MDPRAQDVVVVEAFLRDLEADLENGREETRLMEEWLRADEAALKAKERERDLLLKDKDEALAGNEAGEILVAQFLEADRNNNLDSQKAMEGAIAALLNNYGGDGNKAGGFHGVYGGDTDYPDELYDMIMATIEGRNSDGRDSSKASGGGYGGGYSSDNDEE